MCYYWTTDISKLSIISNRIQFGVFFCCYFWHKRLLNATISSIVIWNDSFWSLKSCMFRFEACFVVVWIIWSYYNIWQCHCFAVSDNERNDFARKTQLSHWNNRNANDEINLTLHLYLLHLAMKTSIPFQSISHKMFNWLKHLAWFFWLCTNCEMRNVQIIFSFYRRY